MVLVFSEARMLFFFRVNPFKFIFNINMFLGKFKVKTIQKQHALVKIKIVGLQMMDKARIVAPGEHYEE